MHNAIYARVPLQAIRSYEGSVTICLLAMRIRFQHVCYV